MGAEGLKPTRACIWRDLLCLALAALCAGTRGWVLEHQPMQL